MTVTSRIGLVARSGKSGPSDRPRQMSEDPSQHNPSHGPSGSAADGEADLDAMLAEATSLVDSLSEEVGTTDPPASLARTEDALDRATDVVTGIDTKLDELESLVGKASHEIAGPTDEAHEQNEPPTSAAATDTARQDNPIPPDEPAAGAPGDDTPEAVIEPAGDGPEAKEPSLAAEEMETTGPIEGDSPQSEEADAAPPDFMADLTQSSEESAAMDDLGSDLVGGAPSCPKSAGDVSPDKDLETTTGVVGTPSLAPIEQSSEDDGAEDVAKHTLIERAKQATAKTAVNCAWSACGRGVGLLEMLDKPFRPLGGRLRLLIGLVALATLGTAAVVYLVSLIS